MSDDLAARLRADFENDPNSNAGEAAARIEEMTAERDALAEMVRLFDVTIPHDLWLSARYDAVVLDDAQVERFRAVLTQLQGGAR